MNVIAFREIDQAVHDRLHAIVGDTGVITDDYDKTPYLNDERGYYTGATPMVVRPASTEEVSEIVRVCNETRTPIVPQGGNTSLCGGATPYEHGGEILLSLTRMNKVRDIDALNYAITVEAGVILADVQAAVFHGSLRIQPVDGRTRDHVVRQAHGLVSVEPHDGQADEDDQPDRKQPGQECVGFVFHQSSCVESEAAATASVICEPSANRARLPRSPRKYSLMNG